MAEYGNVTRKFLHIKKKIIERRKPQNRPIVSPMTLKKYQFTGTSIYNMDVAVANTLLKF